jgi:3-oxoacyl-ACP reductase-like protein
VYSLLPDFFTLNFMGPPGVEDDEDEEDEEEEGALGALAAAAAATFFPAALAALAAGLAAAFVADELVLILFRRTRKHSRLDGTGLDDKIDRVRNPG